MVCATCTTWRARSRCAHAVVRQLHVYIVVVVLPPLAKGGLIRIGCKGLSGHRTRTVVSMLLQALAGQSRRRAAEGLQRSPVRVVACKQPGGMPRWCLMLSDLSPGSTVCWAGRQSAELP